MQLGTKRLIFSAATWSWISMWNIFFIILTRHTRFFSVCEFLIDLRKVSHPHLCSNDCTWPWAQQPGGNQQPGLPLAVHVRPFDKILAPKGFSYFSWFGVSKWLKWIPDYTLNLKHCVLGCRYFSFWYTPAIGKETLITTIPGYEGISLTSCIYLIFVAAGELCYGWEWLSHPYSYVSHVVQRQVTLMNIRQLQKPQQHLCAPN